MKPVFADTHFYLAVLNREDDAHFRAVELAEELAAPLITSAWILTEVGDALALPQQRPVFRSLLESLRMDRDTILVPPTKALFDQGTSLFCERLDQEWSLTDCMSFVIMNSMGLTQALTADHHFEQAGFEVLLR